jgi:hypothetical protein
MWKELPLMWTYLLGPFLALLPKRWRINLVPEGAVDWQWAGSLSGFAECVISLAALLFWYSYSVTTWVSKGLDSALSGKMPAGVTEHEIGFAGLVLFATHPLTWLIAYGGLEGSTRLLSAAIGENCLGMLPLYLIDRGYLKATGRKGTDSKNAAEFEKGNVSSYIEAVKEKIAETGKVHLADEIFVRKEGEDEVLEVHSSRRKENWMPPRTVRFRAEFFRLEEFHKVNGQRPFLYKLRRVTAGVMGRTALDYAPTDVVMHEEDRSKP